MCVWVKGRQEVEEWGDFSLETVFVYFQSNEEGEKGKTHRKEIKGGEQTAGIHKIYKMPISRLRFRSL